MKTGVCHEGGRAPRWLAEFEIHVGNLHDEIHFTILDHKLFHKENVLLSSSLFDIVRKRNSQDWSSLLEPWSRWMGMTLFS